MSLLAPLGLLALFSLPLVLLLHLLRERRRRVVVPSLLLWQQLPQRPPPRRRRFPPPTLLLLLHLLIAALLALALAQPAWTLALFGRDEQLVLIIDTSTSMAAVRPGLVESRLEAARNLARRQIANLGARTSLALVATHPEPRLLAQAGPEGAAQLLAALEDLRAAGTGSNLAQALTLGEALLQGQSGGRILVLTDAALPQSELDALGARPRSVAVEWLNLGGTLDNLALVNFAARPRSSGPTPVYARVVNYGETSVRTALRLYGDDQLLDTRAVSLGPAGEVELTWRIPQGVRLLRAELESRDALAADDVATLSLAQQRPLQALLVSEQPSALLRALRVLPELSLEVVSFEDYPSSPLVTEADLTIFDGAMPLAWPAGAVWVINPPPGSALLPVGELVAAQGQLASSAAIFDDLSLAGVNFGLVRELVPPAWLEPLLVQGGQPLIVRGRYATSDVLVWNIDLAQGNFTSRLAFPLLVARSVGDLTPPALPGAMLLGETLEVTLDPRTTQLEIVAPNGYVQVRTPQPNEPILVQFDQPGFYTLAEQAEGQNIFTGTIAINAGTPSESNLRARILPAPSTPAAVTLNEADQMQPLWPWLALSALVIMVLEWFYVHGRRQVLT
ncbi:vWA domain-containing protein [Candidatus Viridilinea mediisalina]|uniref:VWFA domain-containing protein n=1 Tax=Candidatus Viridilinea mediisalina TaxID=2024553 RepID=A0A2A6RQ32_9CHLR|nr:VWA domain-containing protein [Candidatus Viridilinea mediisalina]PDW05021.1 hypothetical protein CJ255_00060 [Candidatus Viridilinea mediisalina]